MLMALLLVLCLKHVVRSYINVIKTYYGIQGIRYSKGSYKESRTS